MLKKFREKRYLRLTTAFIIGLGFGFLLQKGGATEYQVLVNQLLLRDFTVLKIIFSAIVVGSPGVYFLEKHDVLELSVKPFRPGPIIAGGLIFGAGFAVLGYCPGTLAGAVGTGSIHALLGAGGMVLGASVFASVYPNLKGFINRGDRGKLTIPELFGVGPWPVIIIVSVCLVAIMVSLELGGL